MFSSETDELATAIDPWLEHMRWRPNFAEWRRKRIEQEHHQDEALDLLVEGMAAAGLGRTLAGRTLFDLGCGMGGFAVAASLAGAQVTAMDYNPAYCGITALRAARHALHLPVLCGAGEQLPLPDAAFDLLTAWDVLEHVQRPDALLAEARRVLRPRGLLVLTAINRFAFRDPHYHLPLINYLPRPAAELLIEAAGRRKGGRFRDRQRLSEMHYFTLGQLRRLAAKHGLRVVDLDERRVRAGRVGAQRRWRRLVARGGLALPLYHAYRSLYQGTWRLALVREDAQLSA
jgi:ubiquinone/menaquinone biosynthesis C-methylase UbiE